MPRGEHFKKENPRINQVSFKVSDTELVELRGIAKKNNQSVAEWLRGQIGTPAQTKATPIIEKIEKAVEIVKPIAPKVEVIVEKPTPVITKAKDYDKKPPQNEQMSMF